jgi:TPR repeat protein
VDLGIRYGKGEGVPEDFRRGALYFARACDADHPVGCLLLGLQHQIGLGVEKDAKRAVSLFEKACSGSPDNDAAPGCLSLGEAYLDGKGVPRDAVKGRALVQRSCDMGSDAGCKALQRTRASQPAIADSALANPTTCEMCSPECVYKADSIREADPQAAKDLTERACAKDCSHGTAMMLLWCHSHGLLLEQEFVPHYVE